MSRIPDSPVSPKAQYAMIHERPGPESAGDEDDVDGRVQLAQTVDVTPAKSAKVSSAPMGFASMGSCFVALTNTILGSGMLGLPHAFSSCGYMLGFFFLVASGLASCLGLHLLACSAVRALPRPGPCACTAQLTDPRTPTVAGHTVEAGRAALAHVFLQGREVCPAGALRLVCASLPGHGLTLVLCLPNSGGTS